MASIFDNPLYLSFTIIAVILAIAFIFLRGKKIPGFKEFKPQDFSVTIYKELQGKVDTIGIDIKHASLFMGYKKIGIIEKYKVIKGKFSMAVFDKKSGDITVADESQDKEYELMIMRAKNQNWIFRILRIKKHYFILNMRDGERDLIYFDIKNNSFFLDKDSDIVSYGKVWTNCQDSIEYINDISMKRMNEETMMHLENIPNKVVHLEIEQAKKERTGKIFTDLERSKYDDKKSADDTAIS